MEMQKIIELSNDYYFIISDGKIYTSEGYASDIRLGEEFFDLTTINERPKGKWKRMSNLSEQEDDRYECSHCGNVVHYKDKVDLYTFNSWCGRCGSDNGRKKWNK